MLITKKVNSTYGRRAIQAYRDHLDERASHPRRTAPRVVEPHEATTDGEYVPTPEEIRQACLQIQSEWSEAERKRRANQHDASGLRGSIRVCRLMIGHPLPEGEGV